MADEIPQIEDHYLPLGATGKWTVTTQNGKGKLSFYIGEDEFALANETQGTTIDDDLALAGILDEQKTRFKEHLMNKMLTDFDAELTVPQAPTTSPLISQMKAGNDLKQKQHEREIQLAKVEVEYKKADIQAKLKTIKLQEEANAIQQLQLNMQGKLYEQNERIIKQTSTLLINIAKLKSVIAQKEYSLSTDNLNLGDIKLDTAPLVESLNNLTTSNKEVNQKIIEKINADLDKNVEFEGKMYNKTELQNLSNVEKIKNLKDENEFSLNDGLEMVEDFMINDGFSLDFNPFQYLLDEIEKGLKDEFSQIKTKYNINNVGSI